MTRLFRGTGVALVTPFNADKTVDYIALEKLVEAGVKGGLDYFVMLGTTAESVTLDKQEKQKVVACIKKVNNGRLPLVIGVGGNNTADVVAELNNLDISGIDAVLSVSPSYNKPSQEGIYQHFRAVLKASPLPVILYNVPSRTGSNMLPQTVLRLAKDFNNAIGIKEAAGDIVQAMELIKNTPEDFLVISGDDMIANSMVLLGGDGVISVIGQALPKPFSTMINAGLSGDIKLANSLHYQVMNSIPLIFEEGNPSGIKALLQILNIGSSAVRLPLVDASNDLKERLRNFIESFENQDLLIKFE